MAKRKKAKRKKAKRKPKQRYTEKTTSKATVMFWNGASVQVKANAPEKEYRGKRGRVDEPGREINFGSFIRVMIDGKKITLRRSSLKLV